jgi:hypothetical protein
MIVPDRDAFDKRGGFDEKPSTNCVAIRGRFFSMIRIFSTVWCRFEYLPPIISFLKLDGKNSPTAPRFAGLYAIRDYALALIFR